MVKGTGHLGLAEGKSFVNGILGADSDKRVQQATRTLASAFFIRHLTDADQLADELEDKVKGTIRRAAGGSGPALHRRRRRPGRDGDDLSVAGLIMIAPGSGTAGGAVGVSSHCTCVSCRTDAWQREQCARCRWNSRRSAGVSAPST